MNPAAIIMHCIGALIIMTVVAHVALFCGSSEAAWMGAIAASMVFYAREQAQHQAEEAKRMRKTRLSLWFVGWSPLEWKRSKQIEACVPAAVVLAIAFIIQLV